MHANTFSRIALDPNRIASISGAIAVNGLLLLLLVAPMSPVVRLAQDDDITVEPIFVRRDPPPPPLPPQPIPVTPVTAPAPHATPTREPAPPQPQAVVEDSQPGDTQAVAVADPPVDTFPPVDSTEPVSGAHLEYAVAPAPPYPRDALIDGETGTVLLEVLVDVDGRPLEVRISKSSGSRSLDAAARRQVLAKWRFRPAVRNGAAVQAIGLVPVEFSLD